MDERALIPRFETELLVEKVIERINTIKDNRHGETIRVLDLCTGTGVIGITAKKILGDIECTLSDISLDALKLAKENAELLGIDVHIVQSDIFCEFKNEKFDIIVSNPPYIRRGDIDKLQIEVRDFDPQLALDGGIDGLMFYRKIAEQVQRHLRCGGYLLCEIGADQGKDVLNIFREAGAEEAYIIKDFADKDRIAEMQFGN